MTRRDLAVHADTSPAERAIDRLVRLAREWGKEQDGAIDVTIPLTQEMLASWARSSRESTAKALHHLREQGLVRTGRRSVTILDIAELEARVRRSNRAAERAMRDLLDAYVD